MTPEERTAHDIKVAEAVAAAEKKIIEQYAKFGGSLYQIYTLAYAQATGPNATAESCARYALGRVVEATLKLAARSVISSESEKILAILPK